MVDTHDRSPVRSERSGDIAVIYASDYLNKLSGERIERECRSHLGAGCRAIVVDFKNTGLVNSIGVSIMLGVIDQAAQLFEILGLTQHASIAADEHAALRMLSDVELTGRYGVPVGKNA
jgi:hypothetical protein